MTVTGRVVLCVPDDFILEDGVVKAWSESNVQYERAWWLYSDAPNVPVASVLRQNRPLRLGNATLRNGVLVETREMGKVDVTT